MGFWKNLIVSYMYDDWDGKDKLVLQQSKSHREKTKMMMLKI